MSGCIDQIEVIGSAVFGCIRKANGLAFDGNAALPFDVHRVENLIFEIPLGYDMGGLDQTIGQGGFAMVNVGDDAEIPDRADDIHLKFIFPLTLFGKKSVDTLVHSS